VRNPRLRRHADIEAGGVRGVEARPPARHLMRGGVRWSSGRQVVATMVEQLVSLLDISHVAARRGAQGGSGHGGVEPL
jgi:hypothetical protein